jgi:hypothetical protein
MAEELKAAAASQGFDKLGPFCRQLFRKEVAEKAGLGFELPSEKPVVGPNGLKIETQPVLEMAASI